MNKFMIVPAIATFFAFSVDANAQYTGPGLAPVTVKEAKKMSDDTSVVLVGKITQNIGDEKYTFTDATDSVIVEIDDEDWKGLTVGPDEVVEIRGEVDKNFTTVEIDVDTVVKK